METYEDMFVLLLCLLSRVEQVHKLWRRWWGGFWLPPFYISSLILLRGRILRRGGCGSSFVYSSFLKSALDFRTVEDRDQVRQIICVNFRDLN